MCCDNLFYTHPEDREEHQRQSGASRSPNAAVCVAEFLPDELLLTIFRHLPPADLAKSARLVCRRWMRVAADESLWRNTTLSLRLDPTSNSSTETLKDDLAVLRCAPVLARVEVGRSYCIAPQLSRTLLMSNCKIASLSVDFPCYEALSAGFFT